MALRISRGEWKHAETRDRTGDLQIFSLTLSQLSYLDLLMNFQGQNSRTKIFKDAGNIDVYVAYIKMQETSMRREQHWKEVWGMYRKA